VGLIEDSTPFFQNPTYERILINGAAEKDDIMLNSKSEIALDTPSALKRLDEIWLYYASMDRPDGVWKTGLSVFSAD
jgi:hypothetical protein